MLVTKEYQSVPVTDDLFEAMNTTRSYDNRIKVIHLKDDHSIVQDNHSNKHNEECHTHINDKDDSKDKSQDESNRPPQLNSIDSNKIVNQGYKIILPVGPAKYTSISVKYTETTNTSTFSQDIECHQSGGKSTISLAEIYNFNFKTI